MVGFNGNGTRRAVRQPRRRRLGYRFSIERRAAAAARMAKEHGWSTRYAAGLLCVNHTYLGLARKLSDADLLRLARGELKLAALWQDYLRHLAERRAERPASERAPRARADHEAQTFAIDSVLASAGLNRVIDRLVSHFGSDGLMAVLDAATKPQHVAAG